jgi:hypothetical protein
MVQLVGMAMLQLTMMGVQLQFLRGLYHLVQLTMMQLTMMKMQLAMMGMQLVVKMLVGMAMVQFLLRLAIKQLVGMAMVQFLLRLAMKQLVGMAMVQLTMMGMRLQSLRGLHPQVQAEGDTARRVQLSQGHGNEIHLPK